VSALKAALGRAAVGPGAVGPLAAARLKQLPPLPGKLLRHSLSALAQREAALSAWYEKKGHTNYTFRELRSLWRKKKHTNTLL
jgi:hypothetical protein